MMTLRVLLPYGVFREASRVSRIVVETDRGSFGLLPRRLDCVAAIVPGILTYQRQAAEGHAVNAPVEEEQYIAVDAGILVKTGYEVTVSVREAVSGPDLDQLYDTVEEAFLQKNKHEEQVHSVFVKMESNFIRRLTAFHHED